VLFAQDAPPPPPPTWTGSIGAGLAYSSGNTDSSNWNLSFKAVRDPKTKTIFSAEGLFMRGSSNDVLTTDNSLFNTRLERKLSEKAFFFGNLQFLRDSFKSIDYFWAPTAGAGYNFYNTDRAKFSADVSVGASWEKNPDLDTKASAVIAFGEKFSWALSKNAAFTHAFAGNVVADDVGDGLYTVAVGVAASMTTRTQIKVEVLDTYKTRPPDATIQKNDVSTVLSFVYKF
jgi:putative salt-induced outer membrane protein YdiY